MALSAATADGVAWVAVCTAQDAVAHRVAVTVAGEDVVSVCLGPALPLPSPADAGRLKGVVFRPPPDGDAPVALLFSASVAWTVRLSATPAAWETALCLPFPSLQACAWDADGSHVALCGGGEMLVCAVASQATHRLLLCDDAQPGKKRDAKMAMHTVGPPRAVAALGRNEWVVTTEAPIALHDGSDSATSLFASVSASGSGGSSGASVPMGPMDALKNIALAKKLAAAAPGGSTPRPLPSLLVVKGRETSMAVRARVTLPPALRQPDVLTVQNGSVVVVGTTAAATPPAVFQCAAASDDVEALGSIVRVCVWWRCFVLAAVVCA